MLQGDGAGEPTVQIRRLCYECPTEIGVEYIQAAYVMILGHITSQTGEMSANIVAGDSVSNPDRVVACLIWMPQPGAGRNR